MGFSRSCAPPMLAALVFGVSLAEAQSGEVSGVVSDRVSQRGLVGVQVSVVGVLRPGLTDETGRYRVADVPAGQYVVKFRRLGFQPVDREVSVPIGKAATVDVAMSVSVTELAPVVVTADRDPKSLAETPAAVSVADSALLKSGRTAGLHEVLRYMPGVQATSRFGLDDVNLSIRGSGVRTTFGVRGVAVVVDGVPITEPDGQTRLDMVELAAARQVEVVRGPASILYGGTAAGGVVNIISRSASETRGASLRVAGGSFGFRKYDGSATIPFGGARGGVYLSGTWTESDGFRVHNDNRIARINLRTDYQLGPRTRLGLDASSSDLDMRIPGSLTLTEFDADPSRAEPSNVTNDYARRDQRYRVGLRGAHQFGPDATSELTGYAFYGWRKLDHPIFQVIDQDLRRLQVGARIASTLYARQATRLRATVGADVDRLAGPDRRYVNQLGDRGALVLSQDNAVPNLGGYGQLEARFTDRFGMVVGGRWDRVQYQVNDVLVPSASVDRSFEQLSPKVTGWYRVADGSQLYASIARGFEIPTSGELLASPDPTVGFNAALEPKRLVNYEIGLRTQWAGRLVVDASVFREDITGELLPRDVLYPGTPPRTVTVFDNAGASRHVGLELGWTALVTDWLDAVGSYTWADYQLDRFSGVVTGPTGQPVLTDFAGKSLPGVPRHRIAGELRVRPVGNATVSIGAEWQSRLFVDNANTESGTAYVRGFGANPTVTAVPFRAIDDYALVHLAASYRWRGVTWFGSVENLFDQQYVGNARLNAANGRFYSAGAGRYLSVGVNLAAWTGGAR